MELASFKKIHGITVLNFYPSKTTKRFVASFGDNKLLVTTEEFNPKAETFVYDNPAEGAEGSYILSNKKPKEAAFAL